MMHWTRPRRLWRGFPIAPPGETEGLFFRAGTPWGDLRSAAWLGRETGHKRESRTFTPVRDGGNG